MVRTRSQSAKKPLDISTLPDDLLVSQVLSLLGPRGLANAACACKAFRAHAVGAALTAAERLVPGIGPVALRTDVDHRMHAVTNGPHMEGPSRSEVIPLSGQMPSARLRLRTGTAAVWLGNLEGQLRWVRWLSENLEFSKRFKLNTLPFLVPWRTEPETACAGALPNPLTHHDPS